MRRAKPEIGPVLRSAESPLELGKVGEINVAVTVVVRLTFSAYR
jgi:hypothetical protein